MSRHSKAAGVAETCVPFSSLLIRFLEARLPSVSFLDYFTMAAFFSSVLLPLVRAGVDALADCVFDSAKGWWRGGRFRLSVGHVLDQESVIKCSSSWQQSPEILCAVHGPCCPRPISPFCCSELTKLSSLQPDRDGHPGSSASHSHRLWPVEAHSAGETCVGF